MKRYFLNKHRIAQYYHSAKHLKTRQLLYWIVRKFWTNTVPDIGQIPVVKHSILAPSFSEFYLDKKSYYREQGEAFFLNIWGRYDTADCWNDRQKPLLWLYHLHYFDDLCFENRQDNAFYLGLIGRWIKENPANSGRDKVGWIPFTVAVRLCNWVKFFNRNLQYISTEIVQSMYQQMLFLDSNIEFQFLANHLISDCKGLIYSSLFLNSPQSKPVLKRSCQLLKQQLQEQILADGAHLERSPMYHCQVLYDLLDCYNILRATGIEEELCQQLKSAIQLMLQWLQQLLHSDGDIAFFHDSCFNMAPKPSCLINYADLLDIKMHYNINSYCVFLEKSGYFCWRSDASKLIVDCGEIAPDYQPAHAHAQLGSFELSVFGSRFFVNSGTSIYANTSLRAYQRSTSAHNCIQLDDRNCSDVWHSFRVGTRARLRYRDYNQVGKNHILDISHDGYSTKLSTTAVCRKFIVQDEYIQIEDRVTGLFNKLVAFIHLHPSVVIETVAPQKFKLSGQKGVVYLQFSGCSHIIVKPSKWYPQFNTALLNKKLEIYIDQHAALTTKIFWQNTNQ